MGLFSIFRKNKQEPDSNESAFFSRAEEESNAIRGRGKRQKGNQPADPVLPEKKRARRRLVGAVALVLAMIIGLPMILDSEPKPLAGDIAIQIPSKDKAVQASADKQAASAVAAASTQQLEGTASASASVPKEASKAAVDSAAPSASEKASAAATKAASAEEAKQISKTESPVASIPAAKADESARALAILEGRSETPAIPAKTDKKSDKFVLQVAALASQEKVNQLRAKLNEAGVKSYTQKVATESGQRIRVRVGPFGSKEEAEKMRGKLAKLGLRSSLVPAGTR